MSLCSGPCINAISKKEYKDYIKNIELILRGDKESLYRRLRRNMERLSQKLNYEAAAKVRDQLRAIGALYSGTKDINCYKEAEQLQLLHN